MCTDKPQRELVIPAHDDISVLLIDGVQNPGIGAIPPIAHDHIPCLQLIMLEALTRGRLGDADFMETQGHSIDDQMEAVIAAEG